MKSIQIDGYGGPEVLIHRDIAVPRPAAGEVLIRITHAGINFMDIHTREGKYAKSQTYKVVLPTTLGMEGAGEITALGAGVTGFNPGVIQIRLLHRVGQLRRIRSRAGMACR